MSQRNDIPEFGGDESPQEAKEWLETLVTHTGSFSDSGIFRLLTTKFPAGSSAWEWFEALDDASKSSWMAFQQQFRSKWITSPKEPGGQDAWDMFLGHFLTEDALFSEEAIDLSTVYRNLKTWADDHLGLGKATNRQDSDLIEVSIRLLPPFVQAYMQVYFQSPSPSFDAQCSDVSNIPPKVLELERVRRRISSRDHISTIERRTEEISQQMSRLVTVLSQRDTRIAGVPTSSGESIAWEPCSPVTSVVSMAGAFTNGGSELATPVALPISLPENSSGSAPIQSDTPAPAQGLDTGDEEGTISPFRIPQSWRKPTALIHQKERISIIQNVINYMIAFNESLSLTASHAFNLQSALAIYDQILQSRSNKEIKFRRTSNTLDNYESLLSEYLGLHGYRAYDDPSCIAAPMKNWAGIAEGQGYYWTAVACNQHDVSYWQQNPRYKLKLSPSGEALLAGGLFAVRIGGSSTDYKPKISSIRTILFMTLSSYLAECTFEVKYQKTAILTANCVRTWMLDAATTLAKDCLVDATTAQEETGAVISSPLTGLAIECFSVLATVTRDEAWNSLAIDIATAAMRYDGWHNSDGVFIVGSDDTPWLNSDVKAFKGLLNRGLLIAYQRNRSNTSFCNMVRSYINVQCNALFDLARVRNAYGIAWEGPYTGPYIHAQMAALDTFIAALGVNDD